MKLSDIFKFKLFEGSDKANLKIVNENFEIAEKELDATNKEITDKVTEINNKITELNGLLGGKLDVSKIANNLVTTEEGYVLDARMGKELSESKIDKPNTSYVIPVNIYSIQSYDCNEAVHTGFHQLYNPNNAPCSGWVTVITIPIGADNSGYVHQLCVTVNGDHNLFHRYCREGEWSVWKSYTINS